MANSKVSLKIILLFLLFGWGKIWGQGVPVITPSFIVEPNWFVFGDVNINSTVYLDAQTRCTGQGSVTLSQFVITGTGFTSNATAVPNSTSTLLAGQKGTIRIWFSPTAVGYSSGSLTYNYRLSHEDTTRTGLITFNGTGVNRIISVSPTSLNFGELNVGSSLNQNIKISNTGSTALNISSFTIAGTGFAFPSTQNARNINGNSYYDLSVRFTPTDTLHTGTVTLTHNSPTTGTTSIINLTGSGKKQPITTIFIPKLQMITGDK